METFPTIQVGALRAQLSRKTSMTNDDARALHNPFVSQGTFRHEWTVDCRQNKPDIRLLTEPHVVLTFPSQAWIDILPQSKHLESVFIDRPRAKDLGAIASLDLANLTISYPSHLKNWSFLSTLNKLKRLSLHNTLSLDNLESISELRDLEVFELSGGYSRYLQLPSLAPLGRLMQLKAILLAAVRFSNWSLEPIHDLGKLQRFNCPLYWPKHEIAKLLSARPSLATNAGKLA